MGKNIEVPHIRRRIYMKYISLALGYTFKNVHKMLVYVLIPAVLLAFFLNISGVIENVFLLSTKESISFGTIYMSVSLFANNHWWIMLIAAAVLIFALGTLFGAIDRHMRIGRFSFRFYKYMNETFRITLPVLAICVLITEFTLFLISCLISLFALIIPIIAMSYIASVIYAALFVIWSIVMLLFLNWIPCCMVQGYSFSEGLTSSIESAKKHMMQLLLAWLFAFIVVIPVIVIAYLYFGDYAVFAYAICFIFLIEYLASFSMSSYFKDKDYERRDIREKLFK